MSWCGWGWQMRGVARRQTAATLCNIERPSEKIWESIKILLRICIRLIDMLTKTIVLVVHIYLSIWITSDFAMSIKTFRNGLSRYFPPQFRERERSLPVPSGMMPMAGRRPRGKEDFIESITDNIHPTVPSPPQAVKRNNAFGHLLIAQGHV